MRYYHAALRRSAPLILLLCLPIAALAHDVTLRVDGKTVHQVSTERVTVTISDGKVLIDARTGDAQPEPPAEPPPTPPPDPTDCTRPPGVAIGSLDWRQPGGQKRIGLGSNTLALRFTTTGNPAYSGQVNTTHTTTNPTTRTQWISDCPGGEPLRPRCSASGREGVTLRWSQRVDARDCGLKVDTQYYFNVKNALPDALDKSTCSGTCPFFMIVYTNQKP